MGRLFYFKILSIPLFLYLLASGAHAHSLSPQRLYSEGPGELKLQFRAGTFAPGEYSVEMFFAGKPNNGDELIKGLENPISFETNKAKFSLKKNSSTNLRIKFSADKIGIYLICTLKVADENSSVNTRVCGRIGIGFEPNFESQSCKGCKSEILKGEN